jgi:hypothetical protein
VIRSVLPAALALAIAAGAALADPRLIVDYRDGVPIVQIEGDYAHTTYTVHRAGGADPDFAPITRHDVLCLGACFVEDVTAVADVEYQYRFDLLPPGGAPVSYGPYRVTHPRALLRPARARVFPNPGSGPATIELSLAGGAALTGLPASAALFDAQGRRMLEVYSGTLPRGTTSFAWDGRDAAGRPLGPGLYFLRFATPAGSSVTRVLRTR